MDKTTLRVAVMRADLDLKLKQGFWETPRNLVIVLGAFGTLVAAIAGAAGYKLGSQPPPTIIVHLDTPLTVVPTAPR